ncbi:MAG: hypothetical protein AAGB04_01420 [Pseudomonadota bacterium]
METLEIIKVVVASTLAMYAIAKLRNPQPVSNLTHGSIYKKTNVKIPEGTFHATTAVHRIHIRHW